MWSKGGWLTDKSGGWEAASVGGGGSGGGPSFITLDPTTAASVSLSGGNLIATNTGTTSTSQGVSGPSSSGKTGSGKYYFEITVTTLTGGGGVGCGIGKVGTAFSTMSTIPTNGVMCYAGNSGAIWTSGGNSGSDIGAVSNGDVICVAVDLGNNRIWFRKNGGNWDNNSGHDPTDGSGLHGGFTFSSGNSMIPFVTFGSGLVGPTGAASNVLTANFGATAFAQSAPSGYTAGWPT